MKDIQNQHFRRESIIRTALAILGILSFTYSRSFAIGFILGGIIKKEHISWRKKEGLALLAFITLIMCFTIYFLIDLDAVVGYLASTLLYFIMREVAKKIQEKNS